MTLKETSIYYNMYLRYSGPVAESTARPYIRHHLPFTDRKRRRKISLHSAKVQNSPKYTLRSRGRQGPVIQTSPNSQHTNSQNLNYQKSAVNLKTPDVYYKTPEVNYKTPEVNYKTPTVSNKTPAVNHKTPAVNYNTPPARKYNTQSYSPDPYSPEYTPTLYRWDDSKDEKVVDKSSRKDHQWYRGDYQDEFRETHDYYSLDVVPPTSDFPKYE